MGGELYRDVRQSENMSKHELFSGKDDFFFFAYNVVSDSFYKSLSTLRGIFTSGPITKTMPFEFTLFRFQKASLYLLLINLALNKDSRPHPPLQHEPCARKR